MKPINTQYGQSADFFGINKWHTQYPQQFIHWCV